MCTSVFSYFFVNGETIMQLVLQEYIADTTRNN